MPQCAPGSQATVLGRRPNNKNERKSMNNKFDELAKNMAQSVTRRAALKKFGAGLAGMVLACFGLANSARAGTCTTNADCSAGQVCIFGVCGRPCRYPAYRSPADCQPGEMCFLGRCVRRPRF